MEQKGSTDLEKVSSTSIVTQGLHSKAIKYLATLTPERILKNQCDSLMVLCQDNEEKVVDLITIMVIDLVKAMGKAHINETQIPIIAIEITQYHNTLTVEDLYLVFKRMERGVYGSTYGGITKDYIFKCLTTYGREVDDAMIHLNRSYKIDLEEEKKKKKENDKGDEVIQSILKRLEDRKRVLMKKTTPLNKTSMELFKEKAIHLVINVPSIKNPTKLAEKLDIPELLANKLFTSLVKFKPSDSDIHRQISYDAIYNHKAFQDACNETRVELPDRFKPTEYEKLINEILND